MRLTIGSKTFPTKSAATEHFRKMLAGYGVGERVCGEDEADLHALLRRHPEYEEKVGCGVAHFAVHQNWQWGSASFWVIRTDGSKIDFSFHTCIAGKAKSEGSPRSLGGAYAAKAMKSLED